MSGERTSQRYLRQFERALAPLPPAERRRIVEEIRSHFEARGPAAAESLGSPAVLARPFVEDYQAARLTGLPPGRRKLALALDLTRNTVLAASLGLISLALYGLGFVAGLIAYFGANHPGWGNGALWRVPGGRFNLCANSDAPCVPPKVIVEDLTAFLAPLALAVSVVANVVASWLLAIVVRMALTSPMAGAHRLARVEKTDAP
jgi:hypothetical protein